MSASRPASSSASLQHRLSQQLQSLSEVGETLTLRLLDLEQRLGSIETRLDLLAEAGDTAQDGATGDLLELTDERLSRLEDLLSQHQQLEPGGAHLNGAAPASGRGYGSLTAVAGPASGGDGQTSFGLDDPFPEDGEQAFMDELSA